MSLEQTYGKWECPLGLAVGAERDEIAAFTDAGRVSFHADGPDICPEVCRCGLFHAVPLRLREVLEVLADLLLS